MKEKVLLGVRSRFLLGKSWKNNLPSDPVWKKVVSRGIPPKMPFKVKYAYNIQGTVTYGTNGKGVPHFPNYPWMGYISFWAGIIYPCFFAVSTPKIVWSNDFHGSIYKDSCIPFGYDIMTHNWTSTEQFLEVKWFFQRGKASKHLQIFCGKFVRWDSEVPSSKPEMTGNQGISFLKGPTARYVRRIKRTSHMSQEIKYFPPCLKFL